jgi:hypothetical protein
VTIERQHFSIQSIECAETEGAVLLQLTNGNDPSIDTFDQCGRGRDLKQRRMVDLQGIGEGGHDDVLYWVTGLPAAFL